MIDKELEKVLDTLSLYQCYGNLCTDCTHEAETNGQDCCANDCKQRIYEVIVGAE